MVDSITQLVQNMTTATMVESKDGIQLPKLSTDLRSMIAFGSLVDLELFVGKDNNWQALLHTVKETYNIPIENRVAEVLSEGQSQITIPVRILENGQLISAKISPEKENVESVINVKTPQQRTLSQIEVAPIKIEKFVEHSLQEVKVPQPIINKIMENIRPLQVSILNIGNLPDDKIISETVLKQFLTQIATMDNESIFPQIKEMMTNLIGSVIPGKVINQIKDTTWLSTPIGETFFESKIKLPLTENVVLSVDGITKNYSEEIKFLDNLIKTVMPQKEISVKPEQILEFPQLKSLSDISANVSTEIFSQIINKLPMTSDNLLQKIYNFYQATEEKDVVKWLGEKIVKEIRTEVQNSPKVIQELQNFITGSIKETPVWKIVEMPLFDGTQFSHVKIAVKKDNQEHSTEKNKGKNGTRFVVETNFSKLGAFQFDGFSNAIERKLDLIIRTSQQQEDDFCKNIMNLFKKTLYDVNYVGTIKINSQERFVNLAEEIEKGKGIYV